MTVLLLLTALAGVQQLRAQRPVRTQPAALQRVYGHFAGVWVGTTHDYTRKPSVEASIRIEIATDGKRPRMIWKYTYSAPGKPEDRYERVLTIEPKTATVLMDRKGYGTARYRAEGLDNLLKDGYGDFTLRGEAEMPDDSHAQYRAEYHLTRDSFGYEVFVSVKGKPFAKTSDWAMTRSVAGSGTSTPPRKP